MALCSMLVHLGAVLQLLILAPFKGQLFEKNMSNGRGKNEGHHFGFLPKAPQTIAKTLCNLNRDSSGFGQNFLKCLEIS